MTAPDLEEALVAILEFMIERKIVKDQDDAWALWSKLVCPLDTMKPLVDAVDGAIERTYG